jgi:hypothetical protein
MDPYFGTGKQSKETKQSNPEYKSQFEKFYKLGFNWEPQNTQSL